MDVTKLSYTVTADNINIRDSYKVARREMKPALKYIKGWNYKTSVFDRSMFSLKCEWICHNFLYQLGIQRDRTGSVDLNCPNKWAWAYIIGGIVVWLFVR